MIEFDNSNTNFAGIMTEAEMRGLTDVKQNTYVFLNDLKSHYVYSGTGWNALELENQILVNTPNDLEEYGYVEDGSGTITIPANTLIHGTGEIDIGDHDMSFGANIVINTVDFKTTKNFTFSVASTLFQSSLEGGDYNVVNIPNLAGGFFAMSVCTLKCGSSGSIFSINTVAGGAVILNSMQILGVGNLGQINGAGLLKSFRDITLAGYKNGFIFNNGGFSQFTTLGFIGGQNSTTNLMAFIGTEHGNLDLIGLNFELGSNEKAYNFNDTTIFNDVNVLAGKVSHKDRAFASSSFDNKTIGFNFSIVNKIDPSIVTAYMNALNQGGITTTLIQNKVKRLNAVFTPVYSERCSVSTNGNIEHLGTADIRMNINCVINGVNNAATTNLFGMYICKGNSQNTITTFIDAGGGQVTVTTSAQHGYSNGDRIIIENTTSYNSQYSISVVAPNNFQITAVYVATETGNHYKVLEETLIDNQFKSTSGNTSIVAQVIASENCVMMLGVENFDAGNGFDTNTVQLTALGIK